ncbi:MAG TPA: NTP transferase domain-containing protein [Gemmatimonadales bacterium]|nr:NTP transferase domain-containing protein [Gemmatimonadales bacterium]
MPPASTPPGPPLVVLAAGLGSRYGGVKQLAGFGPRGEPLLQFALHDAARAGFSRAVLVIRPEMEGDVRSLVEARLSRMLPVTLAFQRLELDPSPTLPARQKPWGTAHAVLAAQDTVGSSFGVINADDFYGRAAFDALGGFLRAGSGNAAVAFQLGATLSRSGGVNRGIITRHPDGSMASIEEVVDIERDDEGNIVGRSVEGPRVLAPDTPVSMNMWGFGSEMFGPLAEEFRDFVARADLGRDEYPLPAAVHRAVRHHEMRVDVLTPESPWFGVTHSDDAPSVRAALARLVAEGHYPNLHPR